MKIAISANSNDLEGKVSAVFGRCQGFIIAETEGNEIKNTAFIQNPAINAAHGAGIAAAQNIIDQNVQAVISGNLGPNAFNVLQQAGIKFYKAPGLKIRDAIKQLIEGTLKETTNSTGPGFGMRGMGRGAGRGMGRGRRWQL